MSTETPKKRIIYTIVESQPAMQYWYYVVEAESEEEAISLVENGYVDPDDGDVQGCYGEREYEVTDWKEKK